MAHRFLDLPFAVVQTGAFYYSKRHQDATNDYENLWAVPYDGSAAYAVTTTSSGTSTRIAPRLSPDGTQLAYVTNTGTGDDITLCNIDGSGETTIDSSPTADVHSLQWHPDGTKLLYSVGTSTAKTVTTGGTTTTIKSKFGLWQPTYNADGSKIAYIVDKLTPSVDELWVMNGDGTGDTRIVANAGTTDWGGFGLAWMHSADTIIYPKPQFGVGEIWKINADGTGDTRLDVAGSLDPIFGAYSVSDDDSTLFFIKATGTWRLYKLDLAGGGETLMTNPSSVYQNVGYSIAWLANDRVYVIDNSSPNGKLVSVPTNGLSVRTEDTVTYSSPVFEWIRLARQ